MLKVYGIEFQFAIGYGRNRSLKRFSLKLNEHVTEEKRYTTRQKWERINERKGARNTWGYNEDTNVQE